MPKRAKTYGVSPMTGIAASQSASLAPEVFSPVLARLEADAAAHFGTPHARLVPVAHEERPFSHVLRVAVFRDQSTRPDLHVFVKVFKPKRDATDDKMRRRVAHDFDVTRRISTALSPHGDLGAVRPIVCYVEHLAIVTEQADGETLAAYLRSRAQWFPAGQTREDMLTTLSAVGRWLHTFQQIEPSAGGIALADLRHYIDLRLERLVRHRVFAESLRQRILVHLDALAREVHPAELVDVLVHSDFALGNILVAGRRVVVLDLAMAQRGCALHDISRLYLQLDVLRAKPQFRRAIVRDLQNALLRGYDEALTTARPLFRYLLMLHRINHLGTLSLNREPFPSSVVSGRVRRLHQRWIDRELRTQSGPPTPQ